ncbi:MAG TPA: hemerythrin domain-containing protein [Sphingobium sp.]|uniref:hemerythrin domain-containing protein n=1 Tax=Sphingobium sp. TaxID=1912891 RepID=UPI002ED0CCCE
MNLETLRHQHESLEELVEELIAAIATNDPRPVATIRWRLARELIAHLAIEDRWLYPRLRQSSLPQTAELATRFFAEMGGLKEAFNNYMTHWTDPLIALDWPGFRRETHMVMAQLRARIDRENAQLYPLAEREEKHASSRAA